MTKVIFFLKAKKNEKLGGAEIWVWCKIRWGKSVGRG